MEIAEKAQDVYICAEVYEGKIVPIAFELIEKGRELSLSLNEKLRVIVIGSEIDEAREMLKYGVDEVIYEAERLQEFKMEACSHILKEILKKRKPRIVLIGATSFGRELGATLAYDLNTDIITDCTELCINEEKILLVKKPNIDGSFMEVCGIVNYIPQIVSIRPGVMKKSEIVQGEKGQFTILNGNYKLNDSKVKIVEIRMDTKKKGNLTTAKLIISGGRGMKGKEGFELLEELADLMNGEVGCTRPCVDAGWTDSMQQIGQTGVTVKPNIYIAFGISGAIQHITGINGAKYMIGINNDKSAAIFEVCDYGVIGEVEGIIREMINILKG